MDLILRAQALLTGTGEIFSPGAVGVHKGRIATFGTWDDVGLEAEVVRTHESSVLIPGLVNAHVHLDLSGLKGPIPCNRNFADWLMQVGASRFERPCAEKDVVESLNGLIKSGVTAIGDIVTTGTSLGPLRASKLKGVVYMETLGHSHAYVEKERIRLNGLTRHLDLPKSLTLGFSPHATYTVAPELLDMLNKEFLKPETPVSVHTGEVLEEAAMLESGIGSLYGFLKRLRFLPDDWSPPGISPVTFLLESGILNRRASLVHMNFASDDDLDNIAENGPDRTVVVHCPKSHRHFRRLPFPVGRFLDRSIPIALGTDSLASNNCLDMLEEMRVFHAAQPGISGVEILRSATFSGATALGLQAETGSIEEGKCADLAVVEISDVGASDWYERLLSAGSKCIESYIDGMQVYRKTA